MEKGFPTARSQTEKASKPPGGAYIALIMPPGKRAREQKAAGHAPLEAGAGGGVRSTCQADTFRLAKVQVGGGASAVGERISEQRPPPLGTNAS